MNIFIIPQDFIKKEESKIKKQSKKTLDEPAKKDTNVATKVSHASQSKNPPSTTKKPLQTDDDTLKALQKKTTDPQLSPEELRKKRIQEEIYQKVYAETRARIAREREEEEAARKKGIYIPPTRERIMQTEQKFSSRITAGVEQIRRQNKLTPGPGYQQVSATTYNPYL
jgi:hypothetical protein